VARLLHTEIGVDMGRRFREPDTANPQGYCEDLDFLEINIDATLHRDIRVRRIGQLFAERKEPWGLKEPRIPHYGSIYRAHMDSDTKIIVATRAVHLITRSLNRHYGWDERTSLNVIRERRSGISILVQGFDYLQIDFTERRSDAEVTRILTNYIG
jgi:hypothetical protein